MSDKRNAIKYNSVGLFLTESSGPDQENDLLKFFNRVQSAGLSVSISRQDVKHIGGEDFLERKIVSEGETKLNVDYLLTDGSEEDLLGFNVFQGDKGREDKSVYYDLHDNRTILMAIGEEPFDLTGYENRQNNYSGVDIIGIGNCYITDYSISAEIGSFAKASVSFAASNLTNSSYLHEEGYHSWLSDVSQIQVLLTQLNEFIASQRNCPIAVQDAEEEKKFYTTGLKFPSMNIEERGVDMLGPIINVNCEDVQLGTGIEFYPEMYKSPVAAISPGGINIEVKNLSMGGPILSGKHEGSKIKGAANIQSFNINLPFDRENLYGFESMHVYGRKMKYPQIGTISFSLLASAFNTGDFRHIFCNDDDYEIDINLNNHCDFFCHSSAEHETFIKYKIDNARFDSYTFNESIGSPATIDCNFSFGVSRNHGLFMSGSFAN